MLINFHPFIKIIFKKIFNIITSLKNLASVKARNLPIFKTSHSTITFYNN